MRGIFLFHYIYEKICCEAEGHDSTWLRAEIPRFTLTLTPKNREKNHYLTRGDAGLLYQYGPKSGLDLGPQLRKLQPGKPQPYCRR